jgi:hypothetical protein
MTLLAFTSNNFKANVESQDVRGGSAKRFTQIHSSPAPQSYKEGFLRKSYETSDRELFEFRANNWIAQTAVLSSPSAMKRSPLFAELLSMGPTIAKFILEKLASRDIRLHWFVLLKQVTKEDPVPSYSRGKIFEMAEAWLAWGRSKGII